MIEHTQYSEADEKYQMMVTVVENKNENKLNVS
jgi:hypothetical protein